jgi:phosphate transport system substrate-binding protein
MRTPTTKGLFAILLALGAATPVCGQERMNAIADPAAARGFLADIAELYRQQRGRDVDISATSSSAVVSAVIDGEADFGALARPPIPMSSVEAGLTFQPVAWDAVVLIVHRDNPILNLTLKQAAAIFRGEITSWQPLGAGSGDIHVITVAGDDRDGLEHVFTQMVLRGGAGIQPTRSVADSAAVEEAVAADRNAIGITSYGSARRVMAVKMLGIEGRPAAVNSIRDGSYLLYTPLYLVSRPGGPQRRLVSDLTRFSSSSSTAQVLRRVGIIPYTDGMGLLAGQTSRDADIERRLR